MGRLSKSEPKAWAAQPTVVPYERTVPPKPREWTVGNVMLGLCVGLATIVLGLPLLLGCLGEMLTKIGGWTLPVGLSGAVVAVMLTGAFHVRREIPGLLIGLSAGIAGGIFILSVVGFYVVYA